MNPTFDSSLPSLTPTQLLNIKGGDGGTTPPPPPPPIVIDDVVGH